MITSTVAIDPLCELSDALDTGEGLRMVANSPRPVTSREKIICAGLIARDDEAAVAGADGIDTDNENVEFLNDAAV